MKWAYGKGASLLVTKEQIDDLPCVVTEDPAEEYAKICSFFSESLKRNVETTAVVGSIGKTTTKRMISSVYQTQFSVYCDPENENQLDCVGYISQHIPRKTQKLVQEVSEDTPGCVSKISRIIKPDITVITEIDKSHIEAFGDENGIVDEVLSITDGMDCGVVIMKKELADTLPQKRFEKLDVVTVSMEDNGADYYAQNISTDNDGISFDIVDRKNNIAKPMHLKCIYAKHNCLSALYSYAAGVAAGVDPKNIQKGICNFETVGIRQNIFKVRKNITVYADCYNAVGKSIQAAVSASAFVPVEGKRIAVIGDVEECGEFSETVHEGILEAVNSSVADVLFVYGPQLNAAAKKFVPRPDLKLVQCESRAMLNLGLKEIIQPNDLVLFKASRKSALEETIKFLWKKEYMLQRLKYIIPIIKWRIKTIIN